MVVEDDNPHPHDNHIIYCEYIFTIALQELPPKVPKNKYEKNVDSK